MDTYGVANHRKIQSVLAAKECGHSVISERSPDRNVAEGIAVKKEIPITLLILILCAAPGCSRFRKLTRRDYATLNDPFLDKPAVAADSAASGSADPASAGTGIARLNGNSTPGTAQPASTSALASNQNQNHPAAAVPSAGRSTGPALSDFVGQTAQTAAASQTVPISSSSAVSDSDLSKISGQFPQQPSGGSLAANVVRDSGFAEWANSRKSEWEQQVAEAETVGTAAATSAIQQVGQTITQTADDAFGKLPEPARAMVEHREFATPLINQQPAAAPSTQPGNRNAFQEFAAQANAISETAPSTAAPQDSLSASGTAAVAPPATSTTAGASTTAAPATPPAFANRTRLPGTRFASPQSDGAWPAASPPPATNANPPAVAPKANDPFAAFENSGGARTPANATLDPFEDAAAFGDTIPPSPNTQTLDSGFNFDSGWKPSHLQRP